MSLNVFMARTARLVGLAFRTSQWRRWWAGRAACTDLTRVRMPPSGELPAEVLRKLLKHQSEAGRDADKGLVRKRLRDPG